MSVPISFPPSVVAALDAYAEKHDITRSEGVRRLVEMGLAKGGKR